MSRLPPTLLSLGLLSVGLLSLALAGCEGGRMTGPVPAGVAGGDAEHGRALIGRYRCGSCHVIPGVRTADGLVGPPLNFFSRRSYIGGQLPNTPDNLQRWLLDPPAVEPGTAMPDLGLRPAEARDIAAYLWTLR
jgi:cytochrome c2